MSSRRQAAVWFPAIKTETGTDVFTLTLVEGLRQRGLRAEVHWLPPRAELAPWTVPALPAPAWANVCHVNTWLPTRFLPSDLPVVATLHHSVHDPALRPYKGLLRAAYHWWWVGPNERRVLRRAERTVAVSQFAANVAKATLCDVPMDVIYNGVDTGLFHPAVRKREPGKPFRLLFVGSWSSRKGVDLLGPIMRELGEGFELHFTGGEAASADAPEMPANMCDVGRMAANEVAQAMRSADALILPSRSEGFGLVAAEAMASGLPVIATDGSSLRELIANGVTGLLCEQDSIPMFVAAARQLAADGELATRMSAAAASEARRRFDIGTMVQAYLALYERLIRVTPD